MKFKLLIFFGILVILVVCVSRIIIPVKNSTHILGTSTTNLKTDKKIVALTFDDGPSPQYTDQILNILKDENIKATFFVVGENIDKYPEVLIRVHQAGHEIGNHSNSHKIMAFMNYQQIAKEILITDEKIYHLTNTRPATFRVPYNWYNRQLLSVVELLNLHIIGWNVDSLDWKNPGPDTIVKNITKALEPGSIILMHDGSNEKNIPNRDQTIAALPQIIRELKEQNYSFLTVTELLAQNEN